MFDYFTERAVSIKTSVYEAHQKQTSLKLTNIFVELFRRYFQENWPFWSLSAWNCATHKLNSYADSRFGRKLCFYRGDAGLQVRGPHSPV
jgi:hypothetical protein